MKKKKTETYSQSRMILRLLAAGYLIYLAYSLIHDTVTSGTTGVMFYVYCVLGVAFGVGGVLVLIDCIRLYKALWVAANQAHEKALEEQKQEKEEWGYRPEALPEESAETGESAQTGPEDDEPRP